MFNNLLTKLRKRYQLSLTNLQAHSTTSPALTMEGYINKRITKEANEPLFVSVF